MKLIDLPPRLVQHYEERERIRVGCNLGLKTALLLSPHSGIWNISVIGHATDLALYVDPNKGRARE